MASLSAGLGGVAAVGLAGLAAVLLAPAGPGADGEEAQAAAPAPVAAPARGGAAGTLCLPAELPLFSCTVGAKRVSVCAADGGATYRFGRPGRVELSSRRLTVASTGWAGGGETQITAANGAYSYTVFDRTVRTNYGPSGRHDAAITNGVLVRRGGKVLATLGCAEDTPIAARAARLLPAGDYVAH